MYVVICGGGKVGEYLAQEMLKGGNTVAVIEHDEETADAMTLRLTGHYQVILGDGCDSKYQEDAGIRHADVFVAATGHDDDNLVACEIAQRVFQVPRCIARVNNPKNMRIFRKVGIESISSTVMIANIIEEETLIGSVSVVTSLKNANVALREITIPRMHTHTGSVNARSIDMPEGSSIVAVQNADGIEIVTDETRLRAGDKAIVIAETEVMALARQTLREL